MESCAHYEARGIANVVPRSLRSGPQTARASGSSDHGPRATEHDEEGQPR